MLEMPMGPSPTAGHIWLPGTPFLCAPCQLGDSIQIFPPQVLLQRCGNTIPANFPANFPASPALPLCVITVPGSCFPLRLPCAGALLILPASRGLGERQLCRAESPGSARPGLGGPGQLWGHWAARGAQTLRGHCEGTAQPWHSHCTRAAWPLSDHCMARKWSLHGLCVTIAWPLSDHCVARKWSLHGQ